jgi:uncharacterized membrane protein
MQKRFWQIDLLRGLAVAGMVAFNWMFALTYLGKAAFLVEGGFLWWFARFIGLSFVFLAGLSMFLSYAKAKKTLSQPEINKKYLLRGVWIFFLGMLITLVTYIYDPKSAVWFGVLHLIGIAIILAIPFLKIKDSLWTGAAPIASIILGLILQNYSFDFPYLLWLGFWPNGWYTFDYFPVLPWFGFFLIGIMAGRKYLEDRKPGEYSGPFPPAIDLFSFLGRHSLFIYLVHQPILLAALWLF